MCLFLCGLLLSVPAPDRESELRQKLQSWSRRLAFFPTMDFLWDRDFSAPGLDLDKLRAWSECRQDIHAARERKPELLKLLGDFDPRVRTLALAALFDSEDPSVLPHIARHMKDYEHTFPDVGRGTSRLDEMTVAAVAIEMVRFWVTAAGHGALDFEAYRAEEKSCASRSGWYAVRLYRAERGITPFPKERADKVRRVRQEVDRLPTPARDWTLLWLACTRPKDKLAHFATEEDLLAAAKRLGPNLLRGLLEGKEVSDDPELSAEGKRIERRSRLVIWVRARERFLVQ